jgi:dolichyl-phosphate beta-glucosyltransferase
VEAPSILEKPDVSFIVPVYNEEFRLPACLEQVLAFFRAQSFPWEIIVSDDGSSDGTVEIAESFARQCPELRILRLPHRGKGHAVRQGILQSRGRWRFFSDVDLSVPIADLLPFLPVLGQADVAIGSREAPGAVRYNEPGYRHLMGRVYNLLVRIVLLPAIQDTQCGFKAFAEDAAVALFSRYTGPMAPAAVFAPCGIPGGCSGTFGGCVYGPGGVAIGRSRR